jgi:Bacterial cadherin-like domain/Bacterial Ig-like domain (group 1)
VNTKGFLRVVAGLSLLNAACGGDNLTLPSEGQPAHIEILEGNDQGAPVSTELAPLVVRVTDAQNRPVQGATVEFVLEQDGGGGTVNPPMQTTDAEGKASTTITLGTAVGQLSGEARVAVDEGSPLAVAFTASAIPTGAASISKFSGDSQSVAVGTALPSPLVVKVGDEFGNPIANVTVQWSVEGGGSLNDSSTVTGLDGLTSVQRVLGPTAGEQRTLASVDGLAGSPVTFTHIATAGNASRIEIVSGNGQSGPTGSELPLDLVVRVLDESGNPVVGRAVSWVIGTGGGSANPETSQTDGQGLARTRWTLGGSPGSNTLNAVVSGIGTVTFSATATGTGSPSTLAITTQPPATVSIGATLDPAPVVQTRDADGHDVAVAGVEVTAALSGPGQLEGTRTVSTDANGRAQFSDLRITGTTDSPRLIFAAEGYRAVTSSKIDVDKATTTTTITGVTPEPSLVGDPVTVSFTVTSALGTPSGEVEVTGSGGAESCRVPVSAGTCQITFGSPGDRTVTARYLGTEIFTSSEDTENHQVTERPNNAPVAAPDVYQVPSGETLTVPAPGVLGNDSDPDGDPLTAHLVSLPLGIIVLNEDGSFTYFPGILPAGTSDSFTYQASDGKTTSSTQTVTIQVQ